MHKFVIYMCTLIAALQTPACLYAPGLHHDAAARRHLGIVPKKTVLRPHKDTGNGFGMPKHSKLSMTGKNLYMFDKRLHSSARPLNGVRIRQPHRQHQNQCKNQSPAQS